MCVCNACIYIQIDTDLILHLYYVHLLPCLIIRHSSPHLYMLCYDELMVLQMDNSCQCVTFNYHANPDFTQVTTQDER